jgi:NAD+ diphosphatase
MAYKIEIKKLLNEEINKIVNCSNCGWSWNSNNSKKSDMYVCHKCGNDNSNNYATKPKVAAGVLIKCTKTDNLFLLLRNDKKPTWSCLAGHIEKGESILSGLKREIMEEISIDPDLIKFKKINVVKNDDGLMFHFYAGFTNDEFEAKLDDENLKCGWFPKNRIPLPLYKDMKEKIINI